MYIYIYMYVYVYVHVRMADVGWSQPPKMLHRCLAEAITPAVGRRPGDLNILHRDKVQGLLSDSVEISVNEGTKYKSVLSVLSLISPACRIRGQTSAYVRTDFALSAKYTDAPKTLCVYLHM